ncbi:hypothetical protein BaRGS_00038743, partial [Batillaria attramentaria]
RQFTSLTAHRLVMSYCEVVVLLLFVSCTPGDANYNYTDALDKSLLFYLAQRSGRIPDNVIPWQKDSALNDGSDVSRDLTGGWYDAGDFLKINFPMAGSATNLLWGLIQFQDAYVTSGLLERMREVVKWPLDYFLKTWDADSKTLYGQIGAADVDHSFWGRPEDMTMERPTFVMNTTHPASDLAGVMAAALAADSVYADELLVASRSIYNFAESYRGEYHTAVPESARAYSSSGYLDELCWGAAWLYKATGETTYLEKAEAALKEQGIYVSSFSWNSKTIGCLVLLHSAYTAGSSKRQEHAESISRFLHMWRDGTRAITLTPCGLSFFIEWVNAALISLMAAEQGIEPEANRKWALSQVNYALGDNKYKISYVVGVGDNFPRRPHHSASACPPAPESCNWVTYHEDVDNWHVLYGALVGGPDQHDNYTDDRTDYVHNEVATDYNAGFQSALAGLINLGTRGELPNAQTKCPKWPDDTSTVPPEPTTVTADMTTTTTADMATTTTADVTTTTTADMATTTTADVTTTTTADVTTTTTTDMTTVKKPVSTPCCESGGVTSFPRPSLIIAALVFIYSLQPSPFY